MEHGRDGGYQAAARQMKIQQAAAAAAAEAASPEAVAAEAERQRVKLEMEAAEWRAAERAICDAKGESYRPEILEPSPVLETGVDGSLEVYDDYAGNNIVTGRKGGKSRLADALAEVVEEQQEEVEVLPEVMGGAHLVRWILVPADESDGWTLGISTESNTDEEPDAVYLEITQAMMRKWRNSPAADKPLERFAAGLMEKVADSLAEDLTDPLIDALERITRGELREKQHLNLVEPTRTSVGEDEPQPAGEDEPVPFGSLHEYIEARDSYALTLSRDEFAAFLDTNQDLEEQVERMLNEGGPDNDA